MVLKILLKIMFDTEGANDGRWSNSRTGVVRMLEFVLRELAKPIIRRLGTTIAASLMSLGYAIDHTVQVETALTSAGLVLIDLLLSHKDRKK